MATKLKPCKRCKEIPELQRGVAFPTNNVRYRYYCLQCHIASKSCYTVDGAIEEWNRRKEDGRESV